MRWEEPHHPGPGLQLERHNDTRPPLCNTTSLCNPICTWDRDAAATRIVALRARRSHLGRHRSAWMTAVRKRAPGRTGRQGGQGRPPMAIRSRRAGCRRWRSGRRRSSASPRGRGRGRRPAGSSARRGRPAPRPRGGCRGAGRCLATQLIGERRAEAARALDRGDQRRQLAAGDAGAQRGEGGRERAAAGELGDRDPHLLGERPLPCPRQLGEAVGRAAAGGDADREQIERVGERRDDAAAAQARPSRPPCIRCEEPRDRHRHDDQARRPAPAQPAPRAAPPHPRPPRGPASPCGRARSIDHPGEPLDREEADELQRRRDDERRDLSSLGKHRGLPMSRALPIHPPSGRKLEDGGRRLL